MSKTFVQKGTGSQATLEGADEGKIPIYATKAAADADLANLAVGQIVGTKDGNYNDSTLIDYIDNHAVKQHNVTISPGTADAYTDIRALVNEIAALDPGTYSGEFWRAGVEFGHYTLTYVSTATEKSVTGEVVSGHGLATDQTYQVGYTLAHAAGSTPNWHIRCISGVLNKETFANETMDNIWDTAQQNTLLRIGCLPYNDPRNPSYQTYLVTGQPSQNVEIHAGFSTVEAYCYDGRYYTYDKANGWVQKTGIRTAQFTPAAGLDKKTVVTQALGYVTDKSHDNDWQIIAIGYMTVLGEFNVVSQSFYGRTSTGDSFTMFWDANQSAWFMVQWNRNFDGQSIPLDSNYFSVGTAEWRMRNNVYTINIAGCILGTQNPIPGDTIVATGFPPALYNNLIWTFGRYADIRIGFQIDSSGNLKVAETVGSQAGITQDYWISGTTTYIAS